MIMLFVVNGVIRQLSFTARSVKVQTVKKNLSLCIKKLRILTFFPVVFLLLGNYFKGISRIVSKF